MTQEELAEQREKAQAGAQALPDQQPVARHRPTDQGDKPFVIRLKAPREGETVIDDQVQGRVTVQNSELDDFILLRSDGTPTYMLAVVVDDHDMGVTHVIRGDDHLNNAFRQLAIIRAMGWPEPTYAHVPLIHGPDGAKLSKRHGALGVDAYRDELGILPEAVVNYLLRLGWGHGDDEIISRDQAIEWFDLDHVGKSPSRFDFKKLENLNGHYIRESRRRSAWPSSSRRGFGLEPTRTRRCSIRAMPELKARAHTLERAGRRRAIPVRRASARHGRDRRGPSDRRSARSCFDSAHQKLGALAEWDAGVVRGGNPRGRGRQRREARQARPAASRCAHRAHDFAGNFRCAGAAGPRRKPRPHRRPDVEPNE